MKLELMRAAKAALAAKQSSATGGSPWQTVADEERVPSGTTHLCRPLRGWNLLVRGFPRAAPVAGGCLAATLPARRVTAAFLVICGVALTASTAQQLPPQPQAGNTLGVSPAGLAGLVSFGGSVVKLGTGEPLPGTRVELIKSPIAAPSPGRPSGGAAYTTTTGADGKFSFKDVEPGEYRLLATRSDGLLPAEYGQKAPTARGLPIDVRNGDALKDIQLAMAPPGAISGRIMDSDGEPVGRAQVQALRTFYRDGRRVLSITQSVLTNDLGEYRLFWLAPGQYYISARPEDGGARSLQLYIRRPEETGMHDRTSPPVTNRRVLENGDLREEVYAPVYYPGTDDVQHASLVTIRPGDNLLRMDIRLTAPPPSRRVRGSVIDGRTGQPFAGALLRAIPRNAGPNLSIPNAVADQRGVFEMSGLAPGSYYLFAIPPGGPGPGGGATGRVLVDVGGEDLQNVAIPVPPAFDIPGRVVIEGRNDLDVTRLRVNIRRDPDVFGMPGAQQAFRAGTPDPNAIQPDGAFTLSGVGVGDYRIGATYSGLPPNGTYNNLTERTYLKSISLGPVDVLSSGLHLNGKPEGLLEITLGTTEASITGSVVNDKSELAPNTRVVLVPEPAMRHRTDLYRTAATGRAGRFEFIGVAPGDYKLFVWETAEIGSWLDPDFLKDYEALGTPIRVTEVSKETRQLSLIR